MELLLVVIGAFSAGFIKGSFGLGSGILPVALLSLFLPPERVVVLLYPAMVLTTLFSIFPNWGKWDLKILKILVPTSFVGTWIGVSILMYAPTNLLRILLGLLALTFVLNEWKRSRTKSVEEISERPWWESGAAGFLGGIASSMTHAGGMVFSMYLVRLGLSKERFVATLIITFVINDVMKGFFYGQAHLLKAVDLDIILYSAIAGLVGVYIGSYIQRSISLERFRFVVLGLLSISGLFLLGSIFTHLM